MLRYSEMDWIFIGGMILMYLLTLFVYGLVKEIAHEKRFPWITIRLFTVPAACILVFVLLGIL